MSGIDMNKWENFFNELNALLNKYGVVINSDATADDDSGLESCVSFYERMPERKSCMKFIGSARELPCPLKEIEEEPWFYY